MIDSENNILDSNKLYYYNIIQGQHASVPAYQPYAYISQPSPIPNNQTISTMASVSPVNPAVSPVTVNQVGPEMTTETVAKSDNARVKRAKQRIRQQIYVGKIVSKFIFIDKKIWVKTTFGPDQFRVQNRTEFKPVFSRRYNSVQISFGSKSISGPKQN